MKFPGGRSLCHTTDAVVNDEMLNDSEMTNPDKQKERTGIVHCSTNDYYLTPIAK